MKIGIVQMEVFDDLEVNLSAAADGVERCAGLGAEVVILPEMFMCPYTNEHFPRYAEAKGGRTWQVLSRLAKGHSIYLVGGTIPEQDGSELYNTAFVFDPQGEQIAYHRKAHLFDIDVKGGQSFRESAVFTPGEKITLFSIGDVKIGLCVCFDMRFPELARVMALEGAQIIIVPAAFNMTTGPAHWELMFRQRAVDNQLFTIGAAPARDENGPYVSYGNSIIVSPWGDIVYRAGAEAATAVVEIDLDRITEIRQQLPLLSARRRDLYQVDRK